MLHLMASNISLYSIYLQKQGRIPALKDKWVNEIKACAALRVGANKTGRGQVGRDTLGTDDVTAQDPPGTKTACSRP